jgi:hypothetical protein
MKCDLNCPIKKEPPICCFCCRKARKNFVNENNEKFWDKERGFWSKHGCRLARDDMPQECKDYDCRKRNHVFVLKWDGFEWCITGMNEFDDNERVVIVGNNS